MTSALVLAVAMAGSVPETVDWSYSYESAKKEAAGDRLILVYLRNDRTESGQRHAREVFHEPAILAKTKSFVCLNVYGYDRLGQFIMNRFQVRSYPALMFIDAKGNEFGRVPSFYRGGGCVFEMERALRLFKGYSRAVETMKTRPEDPAANALLAEIYAARNAENQALDHLARCEAAPSQAYADALSYVGDMYQSTRQNDKALPYFQQALKKTTNPASRSYLYISIGYTLRSLGRAEEAITFFERAASMRDGYPAWVAEAKSMIARTAAGPPGSVRG